MLWIWGSSHESAHRFHKWWLSDVNERKNLASTGLVRRVPDEKLTEAESATHAMFGMEQTVNRATGRTSIDGFGTWLWALNDI